MDARPVCLRCRRPAAVCYCGELAPIPSRTRVVFLQHPREARMPIGTCRMAHLALPNSELHVGVLFDGHSRVEALAARPDTAVLFPGDGARDVSELCEPPSALIVVDGTWTQARKVVERSEVLRRLPRVRFTPERPGNYRIRREPAPHCVSTVEAVVEVLGRLEGEPSRFRPMLKAFDRMVEAQLEFIAARATPPRRRRRRHRAPRQGPLFATPPDSLVAIYAEANAHPRGSAVSGPAELIQLVASRLGTGERFEAIVAPRRPLAASAPLHLEVPASRLLEGESVAEAMERWGRFLRPGDLLVSWGRYPLDLIDQEGAPAAPYLDVRQAVARRLSRRPGGLEEAALQLAGAIPSSWSEGRAGRRIAALESILAGLTFSRQLH